jgi:hypothetical protein
VHDMAEVLPDDEKKAMLVCRVVTGRLKWAVLEIRVVNRSLL